MLFGTLCASGGLLVSALGIQQGTGLRKNGLCDVRTFGDDRPDRAVLRSCRCSGPYLLCRLPKRIVFGI